MKGVQAGKTERILYSLGLTEELRRPSSSAFVRNPLPNNWKIFTFNVPVPIYHIIVLKSKSTDIRSFINSIQTDNYIIIANLEDHDLLVIRRSKKGESPLIIPLRKEEDYERVVRVFKKLNFTSDELTAHSSLYSSYELLKKGAERYFINRGLFSTYFLRERLFNTLQKRKRDVVKEARSLFEKFNGELPIDSTNAIKILESLGYTIREIDSGEYRLYSNSIELKAGLIIAATDNLDIRTGDLPVPSYRAVAALSRHPWVILTNGRLWRLYSSRISSASTDYFEVDLEGITDEKDPRLLYFVALFSAKALIPINDQTDLDVAFEGGMHYASELESDLKSKIFDGQLFLNLVRAIIDFSPNKIYEQEELERAKTLALKLLYRLLFILHVESRTLLPIGHPGYNKISLASIHERLSALEKNPDDTTVWDSLKRLFAAISEGDPHANLPQYNGSLFEYDPSLDGLKIKNRYLIPVLKDLTESDGKWIDYQNLGARHLGSLYEALLEYSVKQATTELIIYNDQILDASFASDLKQKPTGYIKKGDLYLSVAGLARKGTGSYFTPEPIVRFLVKKGLEPIFQDRAKKFEQDIMEWRKTKSKELRKKCIEDLLDIKVVDPAMGSGHFLVTVVDEITRWIMSVLKEYPDAPLLEEITTYREKILIEQTKKGISLNEELLTFNVILKRMVMKRCIFGVDINPLAVELAKLSLWLDTFAIGTPLTFLDHHIKIGDSLIGLWFNSLNDRHSDEMLDKWIENVESTSMSLQSASIPTDLTIDEIKQSKKAYEESQKKVEPLKVVLDILCAGTIDEELIKKLPRDLQLIKDTVEKGSLDRVSWRGVVEKALEIARKYRFFHWELEFPDAFMDKRRGFDLLIMNPPWDAVKPDDDDFFSQYYLGFRRMTNKQDKLKIKQMLLEHNNISSSYNEYKQNIKDRIVFYKSQYVMLGSGDVDMWKPFLERAMSLLAEGGTLSIVVPSGIVNNEGAKEFRKSLLGWRIRALYEFENKNGIFPDIHKSYKFVLLVVDKTKSEQKFPAAFYLHLLESLDNGKEKEKFLLYPVELIRITSPNNYLIIECRNQREFEILKKIYRDNPLLGDESKGWNVKFVTELHKTNDSNIFRRDGKGWQLIEGKHFHQFIPDYEKSEFTVLSDKGLETTSKIKGYGNLNKEIHDVARLVFRNVAASTNVRSMISCIIPKHTFISNSASIVIPRIQGILALDSSYYRMIAYLVGIFNSMVFDFLLRRRVTMNLNFFHVYETPVPAKLTDSLANQIISLSSRLSCIDERFEDMKEAIGIPVNALNMKERIELTAKIDALVAHHYGLSKEDYEYIIHTFENFEEDNDIENLTEVKWDDSLIKKFNGEVRKRVLYYYDEIASHHLAKQKDE